MNFSHILYQVWKPEVVFSSAMQSFTRIFECFDFETMGLQLQNQAYKDLSLFYQEAKPEILKPLAKNSISYAESPI